MSAETANDILGYVTAGVFTVLGLVALMYWRKRRDRPSLWAALCFGALGAVVLASLVLPEEPDNDLEVVLQRLLVIVLLLFPYFLYRFAAAFARPPQAIEYVVGLATLALVVWTIALPDFPAEDEPRSVGFDVYLVAFVVYWAVLSLFVAARLWSAGRGQPSVARHRMQMLSLAATAMTLAIFVAAVAPGGGFAVDLATSLLAIASALMFLLGLAPPLAVRLLWRRPEQERAREAIDRLMAAHTPEQVAADVLPPMMGLVGARAVFLLDDDNRLLGCHGAPAAVLNTLMDNDPSVVRVEIPNGTLVVWGGRYAPFFGGEETELLHSLGSLTGLALDRTRLYAQEREARIELERADEMKTNFIALAAHELRTPVTSVHGVVSTLDRLRDELSAGDRADLEEALRSQSGRLRRLVDQLLDLSRLEGEAVPIQPVRIPVRTEVEHLVAATAPDRAGDVEIDIENGLEAVVDPTVFERVVSNLITNAVRHGSAPILVTAGQSDRHFRLAVEDRGEGVPPEFVENLFERFTRSAEARARGLGSGLGLSIARSYARAHGGDLVYEPARPHGARFELVIPGRG
jgi:signal transduction histidine kinase